MKPLLAEKKKFAQLVSMSKEARLSGKISRAISIERLIEDIYERYFEYSLAQDELYELESDIRNNNLTPYMD